MTVTAHSSSPADSGSSPSSQTLREQAEHLDRLRLRIMEAQASGGKPDPKLLAEYARLQQAFLADKISYEQQRMWAEWEAQQRAEAEALEAAAREAEAAALAASSPALRRGRPILSASRHFWVTIVVVLTVGVCVMHWPFPTHH